MRLAIRVLAPCLAALVAPIGVAQAPEHQVRIVSPQDGQYVTGPWPLRAVIVPPPSVPARVSFLADRRLVCVVERPPFECVWDAGPGLKRHEIRAVAELATGRSFRAAVTTGEVDVNVNVERVRLAVSVTERGRYVDNLPRERFSVYEDDVLQRLTLFIRRDVPLDLVVAVDISGSMRGAMPEVRAAVQQFVRALAPTARLSGLGFNSDPFVIFGPETSLDEKLDAIEQLEAWGMTSLYDVLARSLDTLDTAEPGRDSRRALVVFTDGDDTASHLTRAELEERAERSEAALYLIAQGEGVGLERLRRLLEGLAEKSGGRAFFPQTVDRLPQVFAEIVEDLAHQYLVGYEPAGDDYDWHKVRVTVKGGNFKVRVRQGRRRAVPVTK